MDRVAYKAGDTHIFIEKFAKPCSAHAAFALLPHLYLDICFSNRMLK